MKRVEPSEIREHAIPRQTPQRRRVIMEEIEISLVRSGESWEL